MPHGMMVTVDAYQTMLQVINLSAPNIRYTHHKVSCSKCLTSG